MKTFQIKAFALFAILALTISSCSKDSDVVVSAPKNTLFAENFDNTDLTATGWTRYAQTGTKLWLQGSYKGNGYAKFSTYSGTSEPVSVTWLISPEINMDTQEGEILYFQSCQDGFIRSLENSLELYVSTDYDGISFATGSWEKLDFVFPTQESPRFIYLNSGFIDLSTYKGKLHFAFKVKGTSSLTGGYQVDNVRILY